MSYLEYASDDGDDIGRGVNVRVVFGVEMGEGVNRHDVEQALFENANESVNVQGKKCNVKYSSFRITSPGKVCASFVVSPTSSVQNIRRYQRVIMDYIERNPSVLFNTFDVPVKFDECHTPNRYIIFRDISIA